MISKLRYRNGQSTLEYAILVIVVIGALLSIQLYVKRGVQGRLKQASDDIGDQYSVGNTNVVKSTTTHSETAERSGKDSQGNGDVGVSRTDTIKENTDSSERSSILKTDQEYWGKD